MPTVLDRARREGTPLVDGDQAIFVWQGAGPVPLLIGDWTGWENGEPATLEQASPGVWTTTLSFPRDAYLEYAFWQDGERLADPLNRRTLSDGLGHRNHSFAMPDARPSPFARRRAGVPRGTLSRHVVADPFLLAGGKRTVVLYQPPAPGPHPLLIVLDGQDYRQRGALPAIVDNLTAEGRIRPLALALVHHGRQARGIEYGCSEAQLAFLLERVLPLAAGELDLLDAADQPGAHGILGASMGGLMALFAGLRCPGILGHVLSQSGAFSFYDRDTVVSSLVQHGPVPAVHIWMDVSAFEFLLDSNRRLHGQLVQRGYQVRYREYNGGHNYTSWRNDLGAGLAWLFPAAAEAQG
jgi:enterochelin esterase family protein